MRLVPTDVRQALRRLAATPFLSIGAVLILALGIGSAVVMADVLDRLLIRAPAHIADPDRVARVYVGLREFADQGSYSVLDAVASLPEDVEASAAFFTEKLSLGRGARARQVVSVGHTADYFTVLGVQPVLGSFTAHHTGPRDDVAVISHGLWQQEFGGAPDVLGQPLRLGAGVWTIVAVTPRGFAGIEQNAVDVWLPIEPRARNGFGPTWRAGASFLQTIVRLRPAVNREQANERAAAAYRARQPAGWGRNAEVIFGDLRAARAPGNAIGRRVEVLVAAMSMLLLLVTCGNVANLLLVGGLRRGRELAIKTTLGATRGRLLREVLFEGAWLAAGAGVLALVVITAAGSVLRRLFLAPVAALASPLDARVVLVTVAFCIVTAFLLGVTPAFTLTTRRALHPGHSGAIRPSRLLDLFCGVQVALSLPAIIAAALFVASLWNARHQNFGIETDRVAIVVTNTGEFGRPMENHAAHRQMQARLARLPEVESTALAESVPMRGGVFFPIEVPGKTLGPEALNPNALLPAANGVDPAFFSAMRMRLREGRLFTAGENRPGARPVAVISETMARGYWPGESAVGKCFYAGFGGRERPCIEVVGVVADARLFPSIRPTSRWASAYYLPLEQSRATSGRALLVRTRSDPASVLPALRREAQAAGADLPYVDALAFDDVFQAMLRPWRIGSTVFAIFGAISVLVAAVGLVTVGAHAVTRRTREIGIRSALGAEPGGLVRLVMTRSLIGIAAGLVAGLGIVYASARLIEAELFGIAASDPRVLTSTVVGLFAIGALAAWLPARRAARIDPVVALRSE